MARTKLVVGGLIIIIAAVTGSSATLLPAKADIAVSAPFVWQRVTWCPTFRGGNGCDNLQQNGTNSSVPFYPSQVTNTGRSNYILLKMNSAASETGAFNTQTNEAWSAPATLSEQIYLPCNISGQIENWPAFWLVTTGSWPLGGEIDVMEGLHGSAAWHYHYLNSSGVNSSVGEAVSGFSGAAPTYIRSTGPRQRLRSITMGGKSVRLRYLKSVYRLPQARCMSLMTTQPRPPMEVRQPAA